MRKTIADYIFPNLKSTEADLREKYPKRNLPAEAMVLRFAPSPTGFMHIGGIYTAQLCHKLAKQSGGIYYLRLEDTDQKREVEGAIDLILKSLATFGLTPDEGEQLDGTEKGTYGPYKQSARKDIYHVFVKKLVEEGKAYPCFCKEEELKAKSEVQTAQKIRPGYYGQWAACRNKTLEERLELISKGEPYIIRYLSEGKESRRITLSDICRGKLNFPENDSDVIIMKSDGLPTYHFAHVIDDELMGTTHVIRGDEWLPSLPVHVQLFEAMGWEAPRYAHVAPIQKQEGESKRKLSKRKDPEASMGYYLEHGYPKEALLEYLLNLANSSFEPWRRANPKLPYSDFHLELNKLGVSGMLLDMGKLDNISKNIISGMNTETLLGLLLPWAQEYAKDFYEHLTSNLEFAKQILSIERTEQGARKDIATWADVPDLMSFFFDDQLDMSHANELLHDYSNETIHDTIRLFLETYNEQDSKEQWLEKIKNFSETLGYAKETKLFKEQPEKYIGHFGEMTKILRVGVSGRNQTPDLFEVMRVLGKERVRERLENMNKDF